ncbi:hypothetical protein LDDCCGHA_1670 [Methylobacterium oxalidis]|nr:hypothetical protein LDDCCGHA_1670 [Methylobacterium oxalidis]
MGGCCPAPLRRAGVPRQPRRRSRRSERSLEVAHRREVLKEEQRPAGVRGGHDTDQKGSGHVRWRRATAPARAALAECGHSGCPLGESCSGSSCCEPSLPQHTRVSSCYVLTEALKDPCRTGERRGAGLRIEDAEKLPAGRKHKTIGVMTERGLRHVLDHLTAASQAELDRIGRSPPALPRGCRRRCGRLVTTVSLPCDGGGHRVGDAAVAAKPPWSQLVGVRRSRDLRSLRPRRAETGSARQARFRGRTFPRKVDPGAQARGREFRVSALRAADKVCAL